MKNLLLFLFLIASFAASAQSGSPAYGGVFYRVTDTTTYQSQAATRHAQGYKDIYWNAQATTPHWDVWNGSSYDHIFGFGSGGGGTQDFQSVMDNGATANIGDAQSTLTAEDASNYSQWNLTASTFEIANSNLANTAGSTLSVDPDGAHVNDTRANRGLQGGADYSANITANDYTQKVYVDAKVADAINDGTTTIAPSQNAVFDALALKAALASPTFTGTPAAPTASPGTSTTQLATTAFVQTAKNVSHNVQTGNYTLALTDAHNTVIMRSTSAQNLTVPAIATVAFPEGTRITIVPDSTGQTTVVAASGVNIESSSGTLLSAGKDSPMVLEKKNGANLWYLWNGTGGSFESGTFTPTLTGVANVSASTAYLCHYSRTDNEVSFAGRFDIDPTTTLTDTQLGISLPIPSAFTTANQASGVGTSPTLSGEVGAVLSDATNDRLTFQIRAIDVTNHSVYFTCQYTRVP